MREKTPAYAGICCFVRRQVAHTYGRCGNKSLPPAVILRMMLLLFDKIGSGRKSCGACPRRVEDIIGKGSAVAEKDAGYAADGTLAARCLAGLEKYI